MQFSGNSMAIDSFTLRGPEVLLKTCVAMKFMDDDDDDADEDIQFVMHYSNVIELLTASCYVYWRSGWSLTCSAADCLTLCLEMLQTLLEVQVIIVMLSSLLFVVF